MATPYFDATSSADRALLPPAYRNDSELTNIAAIVEADVLAYFTNDPPYFLYTNQLGLQGFFDASWGVGEDITAGQPTSSFPNPPGSTAVVPQLRVYLRGYKVDAADPNVDPNLKLALKRTVAEVITWRLNQWRAMEPGVASSSGPDAGGSKSRTWKPTAEDAFPPDWTRWLYPYDSTQRTWGW